MDSTLTPLESKSTPRRMPGWMVSVLEHFVTATLPVFLVLSGVRIVMTERFVRFEYNRPGFPEDPFGFTKEDRLKYAPYTVRYLLNDKRISYLGDLTFDNGSPLFEESELHHMQDVQKVARGALTLHTVLSFVLAGAILALAWRRETRLALRSGLAQGGIFTFFLIFGAAVLVFTSWNFAFESFHRIFFKGNSWEFSTSDTLIRLFPQQFWFDATLFIGTLTLGTAALIVFGLWAWEQRQFKAAPPPEQTPDP